ncbi:hypothetical protein [Nocardioides litoris]|uniref:hypothetical protein n=1 Tax=Nocardioides litoris TaxID=1926648 RepID=UPI0011226DCB|nr:hypothetical protein [Nocardioides litoris]
MSRPLRLLALTTALSLALTVAPGSATAAGTDTDTGTGTDTVGRVAPTTDAPATPAAPGVPGVARSFGGGGDGGAFAGAQAPTVAGRTTAAPAGRAVASYWPVRTRTGAATVHSTGYPAGGDPSRYLTSVRATQDRLTGRMYVDAVFQAAPTAATDSRLRVGFGTIVTDAAGSRCVPPGGSYADVHSWGTSAAYQGARVSYYLEMASMRTGAFTCLVAGVLSGDAATTYDIVVGAPLAEVRQRPVLAFSTPGKRLKPRGFTRIPLKILNSGGTVATAPSVRLRIKAKGVAVRYNRKVGTIAPGAAKRGAIFVKDVRRGTGKITLIATSRDYTKRVTIKVREVRR